MSEAAEAPVAASPAAPLLRFLMQPVQAWLDDEATEELCINRPGEWVGRPIRAKSYGKKREHRSDPG